MCDMSFREGQYAWKLTSFALYQSIVHNVVNRPFDLYKSGNPRGFGLTR